jgi:hypothetical protein
MSTTTAEPRIREKLEREIRALPALGLILERLAARGEIFEFDPEASGLDFSCANEVRGIRNRARVKCWSPRPDRLLVWFYKRSALPWSRDRYSYGGALVEPGRLTEAEIDAWISYQVSGFHPEVRPSGLRRAFPFDLPA